MHVYGALSKFYIRVHDEQSCGSAISTMTEGSPQVKPYP